MPEEQLKTVISGDASGLEKASQTAVTSLNKIDKSAVNTAKALSQIPKVSASVSTAANTLARSAAVAGGAAEKSTRNFTGLTRVVQDLPFGFIAISNNLEQLVPAAGSLGLAFSGIVAALTFAQTGLSNWSRGLSFASSEAEKAKEIIGDVFSEAGKNAGPDIAQLEIFRTKLNDVTLSSKERIKVAKAYNDVADAQNKIDLKQIDNLSLINQKIDEQNKLIIQRAVATAATSKLGEFADKAVESELALRNALKERGLTEAEVQKKSTEFIQLQQKLLSQNKGRPLGTSQQDVLLDATRQIDPVLNLIEKRNADLKEFQSAAKNLSSLIDVPGIELKQPKTKADKSKTQFLFDFLPFDPTGKLKPEQRADLINAIDKFQKEFGGIVQGGIFTGTDDQRIKQAVSLDLELKAGKGKLNLTAIRDQVIKGIAGFKDEDIVPPDTLKGLSDTVVKQFVDGFNNSMESHKGEFGELIHFDTADSLLDAFKLQLKRVGGQIPKIIDATDVFGNKITLPFDKLFDTNQINTEGIKEALKNALSDISKTSEDLFNTFSQTMQSVAAESFSSIGQAIGTALAGGDIGKIFDSLFGFIGNAITALGEKMIALSPVIASLKIAIKSLNPAILLPAGIALVAIGSTLANLKPKGFAAGGLVSGPTLGLVGEGVGTNRSNPEVIAPLDKLKQFIKPSQGVNRVLVEGKVRGRDLVFIQVQETKHQNRVR